MERYVNLLQTLGTASIVAIVVTFLLDIVKNKMNLKFEKIYMEKQESYRNILLYMLVMLDVSNLPHINGQAGYSFFQTEEEIKKFYTKEVEIHLKYAYLFASKEVIDTIWQFLEEPSEEKHKEVALAMRKDLWKKALK